MKDVEKSVSGSLKTECADCGVFLEAPARAARKGRGGLVSKLRGIIPKTRRFAREKPLPRGFAAA
jgi:hypothetical protein